MVRNLVYSLPPCICHPTPSGMPYIALTCDWVLGIVKLTALIMRGNEPVGASTRFWWSISIPLYRSRRNFAAMVLLVSWSLIVARPQFFFLGRAMAAGLQ